MKRTSIFLIATIVLVLIIAFGGCSSDYSSGERTGIVTKFSKKGIMYKTWEGELNMGGFKNSTDDDGNTKVLANVFEFSLDNSTNRGENLQALVDSINKAMEMGKRVTLHYNQELHTDWDNSRGETQYYVDKVKIHY